MEALQEAALAWLRQAPWGEVWLLLALENLLIFALAVLGGHALIRLFAHRRVTSPAPSLTSLELALTASTLVINTSVTVLGLWLWRRGVITFREDMGWRAALDVAVLFLGMDLAMYVLHRVAHVRWLYPWLHRPHHLYTDPRPLTLFVLHPAEALGFGGLWLAVIAVYDASWLGMSVYLVLNVIFGAVGHLGVEPLPQAWMRWPLLRWLTTSTFHAGHHQHEQTNYGFYTVFWDRLFRTLAPEYPAPPPLAAAPQPPQAQQQQDPPRR